LTNNVWVGARGGIACRFKEAGSIGGRFGDDQPAILAYASAPAALGDPNGIGDSVIRWSIGFEDAGETIADVNQPLAVIS
jgi:cystathionine beta-lyase/cystathionine gamma-synthase